MTNPVSGIYIILNTKNGKVYIGQTNDFRERWSEHKRQLNNGHHANKHLQSAWNKYGAGVFKFQKLEYCAIEELSQREQHHIDIYMAKGMCYNKSRDVKAPMRGLHHSEESRRKISEANKNRSPESRLKASQAMMGRVVSEETRQKISKAHQGRKQTPEQRERNKLAHRNPSEETRRKMSEAAKRRVRSSPSEETRRKIGAANKGRKLPPITEETRQKRIEAGKGRVFSEETRRKISEAAKRRRARERGESVD